MRMISFAIPQDPGREARHGQSVTPLGIGALSMRCTAYER
jgi:hypothetical protein